MSKKFANILLSNRSHLSSKESVDSIINYALLQDAKAESRLVRASGAKRFVLFAICAWPLSYLIKGVSLKYNGIWF